MSTEIQEQIIDKIKRSPCFVLQFEESTDFSQCCHLLVFIQVLDDKKRFKYQDLFSQKLEMTSEGSDVMCVINQYIKKHVLLETFASFCKDGAPTTFVFRSGDARVNKNLKFICNYEVLSYSQSRLGCQNVLGMLYFDDDNSYKSS